MRNLLLATTALSLAASAALAESPTISVGGKITTQVGISEQKSSFTSGPTVRLQDGRDSHIRTDSRVDLKVSGKAENGLGYGGVTSIIGNASGQDDDGNNSTAGEKTYVFVESGLGKVEAGSNNGASQTMKVGAQSFAKGSGGIAGDFYKFVNLGAVSSGAGLQRDKFIVTPDLPSVATPGSRNLNASAAGISPADQPVTEYANKITYYSPRIMGVQAGVSYVPNTGERANANGFAGKYTGGTAPAYYQNVFTGGLNYQAEISGINFRGSAVTEQAGKTQRANSGDSNGYTEMNSYEVGGVASVSGISVGGSYATIPDFGGLTAKSEEGNFWTAGAGYEFGPFAASITYLQSEAKDSAHKNKFENISVGADYKLAPGLVPYVEVSFFDADSDLQDTTTNSGNVLLVGTQLTF